MENFVSVFLFGNSVLQKIRFYVIFFFELIICPLLSTIIKSLTESASNKIQVKEKNILEEL